MASRSAPSATLVRHSPSAAWRRTAPTTCPAGDDEPEVVAERRNQLLDEDSLTAEPRARRELLEAGHEVGAALAERDVPAPAPEAGLDDDRWLDRRDRARRDHVSGARMRQARRVEDASGLQLVVRGEERPQPVQDVDALGLEPADLPDAGLDPVQARQNVEPGECGVTRPEQAERSARRDDLEARPRAEPPRRASGSSRCDGVRRARRALRTV